MIANFLKTLYESYSNIVNIPWFFADQNFKRPNETYGTYRFLSGPIPTQSRDSNFVYCTADDATPKRYEGSTKEVTISNNIYGDNAIQLMLDLQTASLRSSFRDSIRRLGDKNSISMSLYDVKGINNLSQIMQNTFEQRSQMDSMFYFLDYKITENVEIIEEVSFNINVRT